MAYSKLSNREPNTTGLPSNFVRVARDGFVVDDAKVDILRGRLTGEPKDLYKVFENGKLVSCTEEKTPGAREFLRVQLLDGKHGELTLDLSPASSRNLIAFCKRLAEDGVEPEDNDIKLTVRDCGKWFGVEFDLATGDDDRHEPEEDFS